VKTLHLERGMKGLLKKRDIEYRREVKVCRLNHKIIIDM
jgi:hypothetical protein